MTQIVSEAALLDTAASPDPALVGGKAARLAGLVRLGAPVPPFVTVTTRALAAASGALPASLAAALDGILARMEAPAGFAVRSSIVDEDGPGASHAGQLASELGVPREHVPDAVRQVWASARREAVGLYRARSGLETWGDVAVIVQPTVDARSAGVAFTCDPVTGEPTHVVSAAFGLGEGIASDRAEGDVYRRPIGALDWERCVGHKRERVVLRGAGAPGGTRVEPVPEGLRQSPALGPLELERIGGWLERLEGAAAGPQDLEWAIDRAGRLWILQVRPVTRVPEAPLRIWDDSNIGESYPGLTRPLTASLVRCLYAEIFGRALEEAGLDTGEVPRLRPTLRGLVGTIRGRLYLDLTAYRALFDSLPGLAGSIGAWQEALGIEHGPPAAGGRRRLLAALGTWARLVWRYLRNDHRVAACLAATDRLIASVARSAAPAPRFEALWGEYRALHRALVPHWTAIVFDDFYLFLLLAALRRLLGEHADLSAHLLGGVQDTDDFALAAASSLRRLGASAAGIAEVRALLQLPEADDRVVWSRLQAAPAARSWVELVRHHLERHGDRAVAELHLETRPPAEQPWLLIPVLRRLMGQPDALLARHLAPAARRRVSERELAARLAREPHRRALVRWVLARCRTGVGNRERLSHARARLYGVLRRQFRAMGEALAREGALDDPEQIYDLTLEDLALRAAGEAPPGTLRQLAELRRKRYEGYAADSTVPHRIILGRVPAPAPAARAARRPSGAALRGTPCSPGHACGTARVLLAPTGGEDVRGSILVARVTDPGWFPLLLQARGLVVERGSILSHAAILGRELGLPIVVGVPDATRHIRTGDDVELDATTGTIRVARPAPLG